MMPMAGSAYTYTYVALGELLAWIVGWTLILEYTVVCSAVAVGWSGYAAGVIRSAGWPVPEALLAGPFAGWTDQPAGDRDLARGRRAARARLARERHRQPRTRSR